MFAPRPVLIYRDRGGVFGDRCVIAAWAQTCRTLRFAPSNAEVGPEKLLESGVRQMCDLCAAKCCLARLWGCVSRCAEGCLPRFGRALGRTAEDCSARLGWAIARRAEGRLSGLWRPVLLRSISTTAVRVGADAAFARHHRTVAVRIGHHYNGLRAGLAARQCHYCGSGARLGAGASRYL